eukprot:CAMPEP_0196718588 /NCGR_PEP_ID=MMETSP1091-20130531/1754_1 /TAXON_ID=302021 /ORGANISM="Rhodomonas sp., Strain CCMP768" /LENGTH=250 /DNA_ID=CAMNT_0042059291 /DNA_START=12 /DNA_END=764 /DNA_ORIENTATION=+
MAVVERQVFPALLLAGLATACVLAVIVLTPNQHGIALESGKTERAVERGYFDSLEAKDKAKGVDSTVRGNPAVSAKEEREADDSYFVELARQQHALKGKMLDQKKGKPVKGKPEAAAQHHATAAAKTSGDKSKHAVKAEHKHSMNQAFAKAKETLAKEKKEMKQMEEQDKVKEAEQKTEIERMTAHHQADEYERHLEKLNDKVFPTSVASLTGDKHATSFVKNALVDNMNAKPAKKVRVARKPVAAKKTK